MHVVVLMVELDSLIVHIARSMLLVTNHFNSNPNAVDNGKTASSCILCSTAANILQAEHPCRSV